MPPRDQILSERLLEALPIGIHLLKPDISETAVPQAPDRAPRDAKKDYASSQFDECGFGFTTCNKKPINIPCVS